MRAYTPTKHQREILEKLASSTSWVIGYIPMYEQAWLQDLVLYEEGLRVRTFNTLRDNGWIEKTSSYPGKLWFVRAEAYTISKAGRKKLGRKVTCQNQPPSNWRS
jgi:hypothetical protein